MNEAFKTVLYQALGYSVAMIMGIGILSFLQRGFLFKFLTVKASLGKKVLIRIRQVTTWDYKVGHWDEQDLIFGSKKDKKRINNITPEHLYRSLGVNWIDLDGKEWCILPPKDIQGVTGFDPEKQESLVTRALYKPPIEDMQQKIILFLVIGAIIAAAASAYFGYNILNEVALLKQMIQGVSDSMTQGIVVPTG